jgi:hypothetical protein
VRLPMSHDRLRGSILVVPFWRTVAGMSRPLEIAGCRQLCSWAATDESLGGEPVFACAGCGSEWVASEPWTPIDATGSVPEAVQAVRRTRGRG